MNKLLRTRKSRDILRVCPLPRMESAEVKMAGTRQHISGKSRKNQGRAAPQQTSAPHPGHERVLTAGVIAVLIASTLAVYWRTLGYGFILYDDPYYVTDNIFVKAGLTAKSIAWAFTTRYYGNWHPLTWLSLMLDQQMFGLNASGFHLVNLLLHIANTLLLFWLLRRMTRSLWKSAFVAALFALHPLHVESVAWVTERKDVLSTLFWLLTMWAYLRYAERPRPGRYILVPVFLAIGLMAKPMLVSLPIVLILLDWWPLGRFAETGKPGGWKRLIMEKAPLFVLCAASCAVTLTAQRVGMASLKAIPIVARVENAVVVYAAYIVKAVWPGGLACCYLPDKHLPVWQPVAAGVFLAAVSLLVFRLRKSRPYLAVGWLWYLITLLPVIGLVQVGSQSMADRYTYVPLIGIFTMAAWGVPELFSRPLAPSPTRPVARWLAGVSAVVVVLLMLCTMHQVRYWHDDQALFRHALDVTGDNWIAHNALGTYMGTKGDLQGALGQYQSALRTCSDDSNIYNNMGFVLAQMGRFDEAIPRYDTALKINPRDPRARTNMGIALVHEGKLPAAIAELRRALAIDPGILVARGNLADALMSSGDLAEAARQYRLVLETDPGDAQIHCNLAVALSQQGKPGEAEGELAEAVRLNPDNAQMRTNLAILLVQDGKAPQAIEHLQAALQIDPGFPDAHEVLASAYSAEGRYPDAWSEVHLCRKYGGSPSPSFLNKLASEMPDPGM